MGVDWMTVGRLGDLADALGVHPASLWNALHGSPEEIGGREVERVSH